jgi:hypothetical protein
MFHLWKLSQKAYPTEKAVKTEKSRKTGARKR